MKKRLPLMMIMMVLVLNFSCTNDDYESQAVNEKNKKTVKIEPNDINEVANLKVTDSVEGKLIVEMPTTNGEPSNPKPKDD